MFRLVNHGGDGLKRSSGRFAGLDRSRAGRIKSAQPGPVLRALQPLGTRVCRPPILVKLGRLPRPPWPLRRVARPPLHAWPTVDVRVPPDLLRTSGVERDRAAEDAAFAASPLHDFEHVFEDAAIWGFSNQWKALLLAAPRMFGGIRRGHQRVAQARAGSRARVVTRAQVNDPAELDRVIRDVAADAGLSAVGVAPYDPRYWFEQARQDVVGDRVVVLILEQPWEATQQVPNYHFENAEFIAYGELHERTCRVAEALIAHGYRVSVPGNPSGGQGINIHFAVEAGLGQLGLNGQLLTPYAGSRLRMMTINTDAPLSFGSPVDYGITGLCEQCGVCARNCPSGAIRLRADMHRGVKKWKISTERCLPVVSQADGCAVCMRVCPVQKYGLQPVLDHYAGTGEVLGKGTDELEAYQWPLDGETYGVGARPRLSKSFMKPPPLRDFDSSRQTPGRPDAVTHQSPTLPPTQPPVNDSMADLAANKALAEAFLDVALNQRDPARAVAECIGPEYIQHNPRGRDGGEGFAAWASWRLGECPQYRVEFKRTVAEGDLVVIHTHHIDQPESPGVAVVDIFRITDGKLTEHWDVIQSVPTESSNANGMF